MLQALAYVPVFVLVVFRLAGMMLYAPLFGSAADSASAQGGDRAGAGAGHRPRDFPRQ